MKPKLTSDQQKLLSAYRATGLVSIAAPLAGVPPTLHEDSLQTSDAYREAFATAQWDSVLSLEEQARHRALVGTETPVYHAGEVVGSRQQRSDQLLIALLKANAPGKFY